jgi:hypothetical protein
VVVIKIENARTDVLEFIDGDVDAVNHEGLRGANNAEFATGSRCPRATTKQRLRRRIFSARRLNSL